MTPFAEPAALARFLDHCQLRTHPAGTVLISAGEHSDRLYYLVRGSVSVVIEDDGGHEIVLAYLNEGDFFGEIGMFDERHERSAWVSTRTEVQVAQIRYETLKEIVGTTPEILFRLMVQMANRLRHTNRKVGDLAFTDTAGRVARALLDLAKQPDVVAHPSGAKVRITRLELGRIAGCSREMVSRVLRVLEEREMLAIEGRDIIVFDRGELDRNACT